MYGSSMGTLLVTITDNATGAVDSVWSLSGDQGNSWQPTQVDLASYVGNSDITINFIGSRGSSYTGDMAIDEVVVDEYVMLSIPGCLDSLAVNYNPFANVSDSSCAYPPANDDCVNAIAIPCGGGYAVGDNTYASSNATFGGPAIWYSVVGTGGDIVVNTCPTGFDTRLFVYDSCNASTYSHYNDDSYCGLQSSITFTSVLGRTYYIAAAGYSASTTTGLITVAVNCLPLNTGCTDSLASNYDPTALVDDGSCVYPCLDNIVTVNMYNQYPSYSWNQGGGTSYLVVSNGISSDTLTKPSTGSVLSVDLCLIDDCWDVTFHDGGAAYTSEYSWDVTDSLGVILASGGNYPGGFSGASITDAHSFAIGSAVCAVYGCTDPTALNYDSTATVDDSSCIAIVYGCTDTSATNYYAGANVDDGSCTYGVTCSAPITNLGVTNIIHNRATFTFDDMNSSTCRVDQLRIKYREVGTTAWSQKNMGSPTGYDPVTGICNSTSRTDKLVLGLSANTTYEWQMRVWYCSTGATAWVNGPNFTTLADCPNVGNLAVTTPTNTKATFTWDNSNGAYSFVRLQARVDTTGSSFFNIGGVGVLYGTYTKDKNGLVPGTTYRAKSRTWCDPNGGAYKAPSWTSFIYFTMPGSVNWMEVQASRA